MINVRMNFELKDKCQDKWWLNECQDECWMNKWIVYMMIIEWKDEWWMN